MSYCRCGSDSDVYLIGTAGGFSLSAANQRIFEVLNTHEEVISRLIELRGQGLKVPERALTRLRKEIKNMKDKP